MNGASPGLGGDGLQENRSSRHSRKQHFPQRDRIAPRARPPASGKAKLRVVNASSDNTFYDAYIDYGKALPGLASGNRLRVSGIGQRDLSSELRDCRVDEQVVTLTGQALDAAHVYTVYVYGQSGAVAAVLVKDD